VSPWNTDEMSVVVPSRLLVRAAFLGIVLVALQASASRTQELTEVRITNVTCTGLRASQTGLPPRTAFEVKIINPDTVARLKTVDVTTDSKGRLDVRVAVSLGGLSRVLVEVERSGAAEAEYGEQGMDLHLPCSPSTTFATAHSSPTPTHELGHSARPGTSAGPRPMPRSSWEVAVPAAVLLLLLVAILRNGGRHHP
jgi:hypothetical protein